MEGRGSSHQILRRCVEVPSKYPSLQRGPVRCHGCLPTLPSRRGSVGGVCPQVVPSDTGEKREADPETLRSDLYKKTAEFQARQAEGLSS